MDLDDFRMILSNSGMDVWTLMDAAISVASSDYGDELKNRRDAIVERLYTPLAPRCQNCDVDGQKPNGVPPIEKARIHDGHKGGGASPSTPESIHRVDIDEEDEHPDPYAGLLDNEEARVLAIREQLEETDQTEESVVELLQSLADMDITFKALKETDIGRHVNRLRKHPSGDVRRLVKQLVRKWKDLVDEWVRLNTPGGGELASSNIIADGDSPLQNAPRNSQNGYHQVPDFGYSPNPHNGSSDRTNSEPEYKAKTISRQDARTPQSVPVPASASSAPPPNRPKKDTSIDLERLASARRRLHENYQEAQNAKKQRTIQVMDIHEIPKPKNTFFAKNKGGGGPQGRHHR